MKLISFNNIADLKISPMTCYEWVEEAIRNKKNSLLPAKISMKPFEGAFMNIMPSILKFGEGGSWGGLKVVTRYPDRIPSLESMIMLTDTAGGETVALMDGTWITALRTGAVAVHSMDLLAKKDFSTVGFIGLGNTARATALIMAHKFSEKKLTVKLLRYKDQAESFIDRFREYTNLEFVVVDNEKELVSGSDVVVSAVTYSAGDICDDSCFDEGVLVIPIHTLGFKNCDLFFDKVFADDYSHVHHFQNFERFRYFAEVTDVVNGLKPGRENDAERILAYNIGISIHDINYARNIYGIMDEKGILADLPEINLELPNKKFWV